MLTTQEPRQLDGTASRLPVLFLSVLIVLGLISAGLVSAAESPVTDDQGAMADTPITIADSEEQLAALMVGSQATVVSDSLNYRAEPGLAAELLGVLPYGTLGTITDGPVGLDGYTWYEFTIAGAAPGWVAGELLAAATNGGYAIGSAVVVTGDDLNLRAAPGLGGAILAPLPLGMRLTVLDGPVAADGYDWYQVQVPAQVGAGWVAGAFVDAPTDAGIFGLNDSVLVAADALNLRGAPTTDAPVLATLTGGTPLLIVGGPVVVGDQAWYEVALPSATSSGWVVGEFLAYP